MTSHQKQSIKICSFKFKCDSNCHKNVDVPNICWSSIASIVFTATHNIWYLVPEYTMYSNTPKRDERVVQKRRASDDNKTTTNDPKIEETLVISSKSELLNAAKKQPYGHVWTLDNSDSSSEEELVVNKKVYDKLCEKHKIELAEKQKEINEQAYTIKTMQAVIRQYGTKIKKIKRLSQAATNREECIFELANSRVENGKSDTTVVDSDPEDEDEKNTVKYYCNDDNNDF